MWVRERHGEKHFFPALLETRVSKSNGKRNFAYFFSNEKVSRRRQTHPKPQFKKIAKKQN